MSIAVALLVNWLSGAVFGVIVLLAYMVSRMLGSPGWDKSNMTNALRLIAHMIMHPQDFLYMWYTAYKDGVRMPTRPVFPYLELDELSEVVKTRPTAEERQ